MTAPHPATLDREKDTITLKDAATHFGFTVSTLKAEAGRGRLTVYKIGRRYYTTPADVRAMVARCRVEPKVRDFTLTRNADNGSSETERASSALDAANATVLRLRNSSRNTSAKSIDRSRQVRR